MDSKTEIFSFATNNTTFHAKLIIKPTRQVHLTSYYTASKSAFDRLHWFGIITKEKNEKTSTSIVTRQQRDPKS